MSACLQTDNNSQTLFQRQKAFFSAKSMAELLGANLGALSGTGSSFVTKLFLNDLPLKIIADCVID